MIKAWKFLRASRRLGYGDGRPVVVGVTIEIDGHPILCERGIHAARRAIDALQYSESAIVARVSVAGEIVEGADKLACTHLTPLVIFDATDTLRHFARLCALDVIDLWDAPEIVRRYLETGDENIRAAGRAAARDAAEAAAWNAARAAAWAAERTAARAAARNAARAAARAAAWNAAEAAAWTAAEAAAWTAAWNAARADARAAQNARLEKMMIDQYNKEIMP